MDLDSSYKAPAQVGLEVERPRSALHAGDFTRTERKPHDFSSAFQEDLNRLEQASKNAVARTPPTTPWYKPLPSPQIVSPSATTTPSSIDIPENPYRRPSRSRAPSLQSCSSSFILKPPTSPLVQQSNNDDIDFSPISLSSSPSKASRRHTLPPHSFQSLRTQPPNLAQAARQPVQLQKETHPPYQAHQVRRSLTTTSSFTTSPSPQTPFFLRSRRSSFQSEASPIQHASMVGSYEESILRGRMSTTPSKPLDFTAQIGVLGKEGHQPRFPAHVSIDFPAVYYNWGSMHPGPSLNEPSPYVGLIDLEQKLTLPVSKRRGKRKQSSQRMGEPDGLSDISNVPHRESRRSEKRKRRSPSPKMPPAIGGCYRIPQQGQLQILIKNPNKTAVKLFLVPYSLEGMEPGSKTFVRQRCYSAGPVIEKPLTCRSISEPGPESRSTLPHPGRKPTLRYLIQLNICCPSKDRYYLYKNMHVVFANRVPDNKENLKTDALWPEPKYSPWRPSAASDDVLSAKTTADDMIRSKSYGDARRGSHVLDGFDSLGGGSQIDTIETSFRPVPPITSNYYARSGPSISPVSSKENHVPLTTGTTQHLAGDHRAFLPQPSNTIYTKLNKGEIGYGGVYGRPGTPEPGEGLLARRLKGFDVEIADVGKKSN